MTALIQLPSPLPTTVSTNLARVPVSDPLQSHPPIPLAPEFSLYQQANHVTPLPAQKPPVASTWVHLGLASFRVVGSHPSPQLPAPASFQTGHELPNLVILLLLLPAEKSCRVLNEPHAPHICTRSSSSLSSGNPPYQLTRQKNLLLTPLKALPSSVKFFLKFSEILQLVRTTCFWSYRQKPFGIACTFNPAADTEAPTENS